MRKLFRVQTKRYKVYYVIKNSFDEAAECVQKIVKEEFENESVVDEDGGIRKPPKEDELQITNIELLTEKIYD